MEENTPTNFIQDGDDWYYVDDEAQLKGPYETKLQAAVAMFDMYDLTMTFIGEVNE